MRTDDGQDPFIEPTEPQRRPGAELARARHAAGIGLRAMADTLHLPEKQVTALENDDYANLPPPTFVRGYLRSYARALDLAPDEIVGLYDALEDASEDPGLRLSTGRDDKAHNRGLALAIVVLALAVALSLGAWWWQTRMAEEAASGSDGANVATSAAAEEQTSTAPETSGSGDTAAASADSNGVDGGQSESVASAEGAANGSSVGSGESNPPPDEGDGGTVQAAGMDDGAARSEGGPAPATNEANSQTTVADRGSATQSSATTDGTDQSTTGDDAGTDDSGAARSVADDTTSAADASDATNTADAASTSTSNSNSNSNTAGPDAPDDTDTTTAASTSADSDGYEPPPQTSSAEAAVAPEAEEGPERLQVNVDGRSWIEIYDARGRELVYTLYTGSAPLRLRGWAPFDVFLGNSPDVSIRFNGNAVEKAGFTRSDNTARFLVDASGANSR